MNENLVGKFKKFKHFFLTKKFIHLLLFFLCFIFSLYGLFANLADYMDDKNYIITPTFSSPDEIDLPTISICIVNYIDEAKVRKKYPNTFNLEEFKHLELSDRKLMYATKLKIKDIRNITYQFDQVFEGCELLLNNGQTEDCAKLNYTKVWLSLETKCYQFFHNITNPKYKPSRIKGQFWFQLKIRKEMRDGTNIGFLLTSSDSSIEPFLSNPSYFAISTSVLYTIMITYTKETTYKLEAPFDTMCKNYTSPYIDQLNCCVVETLHKSNDTIWPSNLPTDDLNSEFYFKKIEDYHIIYKDCLSKCKEQDCVSTKYLINTKYEKFGYNSNQKFTIRLIYNFAPETLIRYQPRISSELSSILSFITAPISFWLGLAYFNLFNYFVNFIEFFYRISRKISKIKNDKNS